MKKTISGLVIVLALSFLTFAQDVHQMHPTVSDFEDSVGFMSVEFTSKDDRLIYWKRQMKFEVKLGSLGYDKQTRFDTPLGKLEGRLCILYCKTHMFALIVSNCK